MQHQNFISGIGLIGVEGPRGGLRKRGDCGSVMIIGVLIERMSYAYARRGDCFST